MKTIRRTLLMKTLFGKETYKFRPSEQFPARTVTLDEMRPQFYHSGEVTVRLLPASPDYFHRLQAACAQCSEWVPFGRVSQHKCKG